jgi:hypothetical protein
MTEPIVLFPVPISELKVLLRDIVRGELEQFSSSKSEEFLTTKEVCALLKISDTTLASYCADGILIPAKIKNKNIYTRAAVENVIKDYGKPNRRKRQSHPLGEKEVACISKSQNS